MNVNGAIWETDNGSHSAVWCSSLCDKVTVPSNLCPMVLIAEMDVKYLQHIYYIQRMSEFVTNEREFRTISD